MRHIAHILLGIILTTLTLTACKNPSHGTLYALSIENAECDYNEQTIEVAYTLAEEVKEKSVNIAASCGAEWVTTIDTSTDGFIRIGVEEYDGNEEYRCADIAIKATHHNTTTITLKQWSKAPETAKHTLIFYFFGTSLSRFFKTNLEDASIAIETGILGNSNRVIFFRQESKNSGYIGELCYNFATKECEEKRLKDITLTNSIITPEEIGMHIATMADIAPAERYGIVFAGHGQGWITREIINRDGDISPSALSAGYNPWIPAAGAEVTRAFGEGNVQVNIDELAEGIEHSQVELDYILFDACFMSNIEAIYDLRNSANYIIASPCEIMGKGFPYHRTLHCLFKDGGESTDYIGAAESYHLYYRNEYVGSSRCGSISLYDCNKIDELAVATKEVMKSAKQEGEYEIKGLQTYEGQSIHHFYDFGQWVNVVATDEESLATFNNKMEEAVVASFTLDSFYSAYGNYGTYPIDLDVYTGVTTSAPSKAYPNGWKQTNWYKEVFELEN